MNTYFKVLKKITFPGVKNDSGYPGLISKQDAIVLKPKQLFSCEFFGASQVSISTQNRIYNIDIFSLAQMILKGEVLEIGICKKEGEHTTVIESCIGGWGHVFIRTRCTKCNMWI